MYQDGGTSLKRPEMAFFSGNSTRLSRIKFKTLFLPLRGDRQGLHRADFVEKGGSVLIHNLGIQQYDTLC